MKISQIIDKIDEKQLFVPAFQREYVWKRPNAKDLISSLILEYPTGTMLTWETNNPPELKGDHKYDERQGAVKLILDGQQRYNIIHVDDRKIPPYYKEHEILTDIRNLMLMLTLSPEYYKIKLCKMIHRINRKDISNGKVRSRDVVSDLEEKLEGERISRDREDIIDDNFKAIERIKDRDFQEQIILQKPQLKKLLIFFTLLMQVVLILLMLN